MANVAYELCPGVTAFEFPGYDGTLIRIEAAGYETDDPRLQGELDLQGHAVQRAATKK